MTWVKQADTWHIVDPDGKPDPLERRPHLRSKCEMKTHMGTFDAPIDDGPVCGSSESRAHWKALAEARIAGLVDLETRSMLEKDKKAAEARIRAEVEADYLTFCT